MRNYNRRKWPKLAKIPDIFFHISETGPNLELQSLIVLDTKKNWMIAGDYDKILPIVSEKTCPKKNNNSKKLGEFEIFVIIIIVN